MRTIDTARICDQLTELFADIAPTNEDRHKLTQFVKECKSGTKPAHKMAAALYRGLRDNDWPWDTPCSG